MKKSKPPKTKKLTYQLIEPDSPAGVPMYAMLEALVIGYHEDLAQARIALAWNLTWKPDVDGRVQIGKCKKASDLDREVMEFDFILILQREFWQETGVDDRQRRALLDHLLCHGALKFDSDGEPVEDERGRKVYRIRKHDIEDFTEVIERHGCYKRDLEQFAVALRKSKQPSLLENDVGEKPHETNQTSGRSEKAQAHGHPVPGMRGGAGDAA